MSDRSMPYLTVPFLTDLAGIPERVPARHAECVLARGSAPVVILAPAGGTR